MESRWSVTSLLIALGAMIVAACGPVAGGPAEKTLYVGPYLVDCVGVAPQKCMLVKEDPSRYMPYFEMFRVYNKMGEHEKSLQALGTYLSLNPEEDPIGERVYRKYYDAMYPHGRPDRSDGK